MEPLVPLVAKVCHRLFADLLASIAWNAATYRSGEPAKTPVLDSEVCSANIQECFSGVHECEKRCHDRVSDLLQFCVQGRDSGLELVLLILVFAVGVVLGRHTARGRQDSVRRVGGDDAPAAEVRVGGLRRRGIVA